MSFYLTYKEYMQKQYGHALYSIPVDLDLGCPNRDKDGKGGCTFCPENGSRATQALDAKSVEEQIKKGIEFAKKRYKAERFMLYIQAYTGTFTSLKQQKDTYSKLLKLYPFDAISIGTRPDCLSDGTLAYLAELNKEISVHVDLGIQTLNDKTLININREHDGACSLEAIKKLQRYGLKVFTHIIIGFDGESRVDWEHTVKTLVSHKVDGIKIHNLHVIKNTSLHVEYQERAFKTYDEYEYAEELIHLLRLIPSHIPVLRIATDTPDKDLVAPKWQMSKGEFGEYIKDTMQYRFGKSDVDESFWSKKYKDYFYPKSGAVKQAQELFIASSELEKRLTCKDVKLLDIGFGFGVNSHEALRVSSHNSLHVTALDQDKRVAKLGKNIDFIVGDVRYTLPKLKGKFDIIFLDPFDEEKNPEMVSKNIFENLKRLLKEDGVLVTSTFLNSTKKRLELVGFKTQIININDIRGLVANHQER